MTWDKPRITDNNIAGTINDLKNLRNIISYKLTNFSPGQTFNIDKEYSDENTVTAMFFIMADEFDPVSLDRQLFLYNIQIRPK